LKNTWLVPERGNALQNSSRYWAVGVHIFRPRLFVNLGETDMSKSKIITSTAFTVTAPEEVLELPWKGNYAADAELFEAVSRYVRSEPDLQKAYLAERHCHKLGCGEELPEAPDQETLDWLKQQHQDWLDYSECF
jgi:hypothetical protein